MANSYNNLIALSSGEVLIDLTQDDVTPEHVQQGKWFHDRTGEKKQGTNTKTVDASKATATAEEVLAGETFGRGDILDTGTMPNNIGKTVEITSLAGTPIPRGYFDGSTLAKLSEAEAGNIIAGNIKQGVTILGVDGTYKPEDKTAIAKTVDPTFSDVTYQPSDDDSDFYSSVTVNAIKVTRTDNEFGGVTVTIG